MEGNYEDVQANGRQIRWWRQWIQTSVSAMAQCGNGRLWPLGRDWACRPLGAIWICPDDRNYSDHNTKSNVLSQHGNNTIPVKALHESEPLWVTHAGNSWEPDLTQTWICFPWIWVNSDPWELGAKCDKNNICMLHQSIPMDPTQTQIWVNLDPWENGSEWSMGQLVESLDPSDV